MKILALVLLSSTMIHASNLVKNPGFESYSSLPTCNSHSFNINLAHSWAPSLDAQSYGPEYLHQNSSLNNCVNLFPEPRGGNAHGGFAVSTYDDPFRREYIVGSLDTDLEAGRTYRVKFYVKSYDVLQDTEIGIYFFNNASNTNCFGKQPQISQVVSSSMGYDYIEISGTYTPNESGSYKFAVGCFDTNPINQLEYFYVDDVSIEPVYHLGFTLNETWNHLIPDNHPHITICGANITLANFNTDNPGYEHWFIGVQESDPWWSLYGPAYSQWFSAPFPSNYSLRDFAMNHGFTFVPGKYYRVKLAITSPWTSESVLIYIQESEISTEINGSPDSVVHIEADEPITLTTAGSACLYPYYISLQLSDAEWNRYFSQTGAWFPGNIPPSINLTQFAADYDFVLEPGNYYRLIVATDPPWNAEVKLIYLEP